MAKVIFLKKQEDLFSDMPSNSSNPCLNCGACCAHFRVSFYFGETDSHPQGYVPSELVMPLTPHRVAMKGTDQKNPRCVALTGEVGQSIGCSIYENRPSVCRQYHVWDPLTGKPNEDCQKLRQKIGLPLLEPLDID